MIQMNGVVAVAMNVKTKNVVVMKKVKMMPRKLNEKDFFDVTKTLLLLQILLEQMDCYKSKNMYKQRLKKQMKGLESSLEIYVRAGLEAFDRNEGGKIFDELQERMEMILDLSLDEIAQLRKVIKEHRDEEVVKETV